ncbi:MAG TPA: hypothetical protein VF142_22490 [Longimicrobium sp.]
MSDTTTQQFNAAIAPISAASIVTQGQLGPQIVGSGTMNFQGPGTLYLYYAPQQAGQSSVLYANNYGNPNTPLQPYTWTTIPNVQSLNLNYSVNPGSDLKLAWAIGS